MHFQLQLWSTFFGGKVTLYIKMIEGAFEQADQETNYGVSAPESERLTLATA